MVFTHYLKLAARVVISVCASLFILFYNRPLDLTDALTSLAFYAVFVISTLVAFILVQIVHSMTLWLDRRVTWDDNFVIRFILQAALGLMLPIMIDFWFFKIYFASRGESIYENGFYSIDFPAVCILLLSLNLLYGLLYYRTQTLKLKQEKESTAYLPLEYRGKEYTIDIKNEVLYFSSTNKQVRAYLKSGNSYPITDTLTTLAEKYSDYGFCQINRSTVINLEIIKAFKNGEKRHTLELTFKEGINLEDQNSTLFIVTRDNITEFKRKFGL
ncbi:MULTISPECIES: LytTR family DNA-binding domain-containing protein [unclassified Flavobacterium]|uniref:LytTR family DNA-binding domain-containing protein n=1 Tax=unclassified Flavobacterium TaxID=196869 RepID=UPI000969E8A9|nr:MULTISPECIES: LytTR family DNA-binding domain-containing protein [unclassified Flavobacterium]MBN9284103.1 LytTR family transcriptional regulator [Flavobacterium sp.]OJV71118.1 MAG: hypothetical protein BGO42_04710 [Flavobacterium sp. 40-81]